MASFGSFRLDDGLEASADYTIHRRRRGVLLRHHSCDVLLGRQVLANRPRSYPDPPRLDVFSIGQIRYPRRAVDTVAMGTAPADVASEEVLVALAAECRQ